MSRNVKRVVVSVDVDGHTHDVFTGTLVPDVPYQFWHRVLPDPTTVDLPPLFKVREIEEEEEEEEEEERKS